MKGNLVFREDQIPLNSVFVEDQVRTAIREKIADALDAPFPSLTRRETVLPDVAGKVHAITGMRRAGKTCFLQQTLGDALAAGVPRERLLYFNFEDDRLGALTGEELPEVFECYYALFPETRRASEVWFCFDEIQLVPNWEGCIRRVLDTEKTRLFISGSSAKMLSREVATSMRGRALETTITPFSFREFLAAIGVKLTAGALANPTARTRSLLQNALADYVRTGGFPEVVAGTAGTTAVAGTADAGDAMRERTRVRLLQSYVDAVLFRDVAERHQVANLTALRAFVRQLLSAPACEFSVSKIANDFHSRGLAVSKETLLAFLDYFTDAFLVAPVALHTRSERRRQVNPRKLYLADHSLAAAFAPASALNRGRLLENIVACELFRRFSDITYYKTAGGLEVDFCVTDFSGARQLIQVTENLNAPDTRDREINALLAAAAEQPDAACLLLCAETPPTGFEPPAQIRLLPLWQWLAGGMP